MAFLEPKREYYIPKGAMKIAPKSCGVVFYVYQNAKGRDCAMCFIGKAQKPSWHFNFIKPGQREKRIRDQIASVEAREKASAERRAKANKPHNLEKGVILYSSWGYDQTNIDYYEVIDVPSKCYVILQKIGAPLARGEEGFMSGNSVPDPKSRIGEPFRRKVDMSGSDPSIRIDNCAFAWIWDGREKRCSWYA